MPLQHLLLNGERVPLDAASATFDEAGIMPAAAVQAIIEDESRTNPLPTVNPSFAAPMVNCRRKLILQKYSPYDMDPMSRWKATVGGFWHGFLAGLKREGWRNEHYLPDQEGADDEHPKVKVVAAPWGKNIRLVEAFPGWWTRVRLDLVSPDWDTLVDYKSSDKPWDKYKDKDLADIWPIQLSVEAHIIELLRGVRPKEGWVWYLFHGTQFPSKPIHPWRKAPVRLIPSDRLWYQIGEHVLTTQGWLEKAMTATNPMDVAKEVPPDGIRQNMFGGWLCDKGCPVRKACDSLEGMLEY